MNKTTRRGFIAAGTAGVLGGAWLAVPQQAAPPGPLTVAVINDLHITTPDTTSFPDAAMEAINRDARVALTVVAGDLVGLACKSQMACAAACVGRLTKPFLTLPGNHDMLPIPTRALVEFKRFFGEPHWVRDLGAWTLLGFNSCEGMESDVTVPAEELDWLRARIAETDPGRPVALFCHHPLNPHTQAYRVENAEEILALFSGHRLRVAVAGHWHGNQEEERDGVLFATTVCCSMTRDNFDGTKPEGYRLLHLADDGGVTTEFVEVSPATSPP